MKKNSTSGPLLHRPQRQRERGGNASSSTRIVDRTLASQRVQQRRRRCPGRRTALVPVQRQGAKNVGGLVAASVSCLNDVRTIQNDREEEPQIPTTQATTPEGLNLRLLASTSAPAPARHWARWRWVRRVALIRRLFLAGERFEDQPQREGRDDHREDDDDHARRPRPGRCRSRGTRVVDVERQVRTGRPGPPWVIMKIASKC